MRQKRESDIGVVGLGMRKGGRKEGQKEGKKRGRKGGRKNGRRKRERLQASIFAVATVKKKSVVFIAGSQTVTHSGPLAYENMAQDLVVPYFSQSFFSFSYCII